jgi:hypothetical protein
MFGSPLGAADAEDSGTIVRAAAVATAAARLAYLGTCLAPFGKG